MQNCNIFIKIRLNDVITYIFLYEMSIKIIALGPKVYASNGINLFDGIITILALIDISIVYNFSFN